MPQSIARYTLLMLLLLLAQVLICSHIMLFGLAMPIIYIYFILHLPMGLNVKWVLILSFLLGFIVDIFSDTPGVNTISCTMLAVLRRPVFNIYSGNDETMKSVVPSMKTLGTAVYAKYLFTLTLIFCTLDFSLEYFSFTHPGRMMLKIVASTLLSSFVLLGIDGLMGGSKN